MAARSGDVAIICDGASFTYQELAVQASSVARRLLSDGVAPGDRVGLACSRSALAPAAMLGVLLAGGVFVPVDPAEPGDRLRGILARSSCRLLISDTPGLPLKNSGYLRSIDLSAAATDGAGGVMPGVARAADDPASVMFTSGSTGAPKGAVIPHRAIARLALGLDRYVDLTPGCRFLQLSPLAFDASTLEIWGPLLRGGAVIVCPGAFDPRVIARVIREQKATAAWLTAALFNHCVDHHPECFDGLATVLTGGDVVSPTHVAKLYRRNAAITIVNGYGPTENTTFTTCYTVPREYDGPTLPIGEPVAGTGVCIVNQDAGVTPAGQAGELVAFGDGLALGYIDDEPATRERFIEIEIAGQRLRGYRTGDLARLGENGLFEFHGRVDDQVKIRGYRVEPSEIEELLVRQPGVMDAAVVSTGSGSERQLHAFVTADSVESWIERRVEMMRALEERVPAYMIPQSIALLDRMPIGPTGKADRRMLRERIERGVRLSTPLDAAASDSLAFRAALAATAVVLAHRWRPFDETPRCDAECEGETVSLGTIPPEFAIDDARARIEETLSARRGPISRVTLDDPSGRAVELVWREGLWMLSPPGTSERILRWRSAHVVAAARAVLEGGQRRIAEISLLTAEEAAQIDQWNATNWEHGVTATLIDQFERCAIEHPDRVAIRAPSATLSYGQLRDRVHRTARRLLDRGARPGDRIGLVDNRTLESIIGVLATQRAAMVCVPISSDTPRARAEQMLSATDAKIVLFPHEVHSSMASGRAAVNVVGAQDESDVPGLFVGTGPDLRDDAYILFTSGSSGTPKAVPIRHESLVNRIAWNTELLRVQPSDVFAQKTILAWDVSIWEYLCPLTAGASCVVLPRELTADPRALMDAFARFGVTITHFVPSFLRPAAKAASHRGDLRLRATVCSGEALLPDAADAYLASVRGDLYNLYGPTEAAIEVTIWRCRPGSPEIPIGRPAPNTSLLITDERGEPCPVGVVGELCLKGIQVSSGYLNLPSGAPSPFRTDARDPRSTVYRTGDLAFWREDGVVGFIGRKDAQIKMFGFRIEPSEVERFILDVDGVADATVFKAGEDGSADLVAACIASPGVRSGDVEPLVREFLREKLEPYKIPARFVWLDNLPRLPNGKIDRRSLIELSSCDRSSTGPQRQEAPGREGRPSAVEAVYEAWARVIGHPPESDNADFVAAGGNSLAFLRLLFEVESKLNVNLPRLPTVDDPTPAAIARLYAQFLDDPSTNTDPHARPIRNRGGRLICLSAGRMPVVMIPHLGGSIGFLKDIVDTRDGIFAWHAIVPAGLDQGEAPLQSVDAIVDAYVAMITRKNWDRIVLAGHSIGGALALAIATRLETTTTAVAALLVVDGFPCYRPPPVRSELGLKMWWRIRKRLPIRWVPLTAPGSVRLRFEDLSNTIDAQRALAAAWLRAFHRHRPSVYRGKALVVRRALGPPDVRLESWRRVLKGVSREVVFSDVHHMELLTGTRSRTVTDELARLIDP